MSQLMETAMQMLAAKGALVERHPTLAAAGEAIRRAIPEGAAVTVHGSLPAAVLPHLEGRQVSNPAALGEGARTAILRAEFGLTGATAVVARTGSIVLAEADGFGRAISNMAPVHVVVATAADLVEDVYAGVERANRWAQQACGRPAPPFMTIISGPSRTADVEFVLVQGAHGPVEVRVYLVDAEG